MNPDPPGMATLLGVSSADLRFKVRGVSWRVAHTLLFMYATQSVAVRPLAPGVDGAPFRPDGGRIHKKQCMRHPFERCSR